MNERIRELAVQAGEEAVKSVPFFRTGRCQIPSWVNVFIEVRDKKFAELMTREAIAVVQKRFMGDLNREDMEVRRCVEDLKKHFGVE